MSSTSSCPTCLFESIRAELWANTKASDFFDVGVHVTKHTLSYLAPPWESYISSETPDYLSSAFLACHYFHDVCFDIRYCGFIHGAKILYVDDEPDSFLSSNASFRSFQRFLRVVAELHGNPNSNSSVQLAAVDQRQPSYRQTISGRPRLGRRCKKMRYDPSSCFIRLQVSFSRWRELCPVLAKYLPYLTRLSVDCGYFDALRMFVVFC